MKTIDMVGYYRQDLGRSKSQALRKEGMVPCVLYGNGQNVHFSVPMILFREVVYTPEVCFINLDIEGDLYQCVFQDVQFHPVSEIILHADFLQLADDKKIKLEVPVKFTGSAPGILKGGKLVSKLRKVKLKGYPKDMPDYVEVPIDGLELGQSVKVGVLAQDDYQILNNKMVTIATVEVPRSLKSAQSKGEEEGK